MRRCKHRSVSRADPVYSPGPRSANSALRRCHTRGGADKGKPRGAFEVRVAHM